MVASVRSQRGALILEIGVHKRVRGHCMILVRDLVRIVLADGCRRRVLSSGGRTPRRCSGQVGCRTAGVWSAQGTGRGDLANLFEAVIGRGDASVGVRRRSRARLDRQIGPGSVAGRNAIVVCNDAVVIDFVGCGRIVLFEQALECGDVLDGFMQRLDLRQPLGAVLDRDTLAKLGEYSVHSLDSATFPGVSPGHEVRRLLAMGHMFVCGSLLFVILRTVFKERGLGLIR